jgi:hypothetical protein
MLGELIIEGKGKITMRRVLESAAGGHNVEVSFQNMVKLLGVEGKEIATYISTMKPGGNLYGTGQGVIMTKDSDSVAWVGAGTGRFKPDGGVSFRGAVYLETQSQKLARLNGMAAVFEYEEDANDNCTSKAWEWK